MIADFLHETGGRWDDSKVGGWWEWDNQQKSKSIYSVLLTLTSPGALFAEHRQTEQYSVSANITDLMIMQDLSS